MIIDLLHILGVLIIFQSLFFFFFLITHPKGKKVSNYLMAALSLAIALLFVNLLLTQRQILGTIPAFNPLFAMLFMPLIYFYSKSLMYKKLKISRREWRLTILLNGPLLLYAVYWIFDDFARQLLGEPTNNAITGPILIQMAVYFVWIFREIRQYKKTIRQTRSSVDAISLSWIQFILSLFLILFVILSLEFFLNNATWQEYIVLAIFAVVLFMLNAFVYKGLRQPRIFGGLEYEEKSLSTAGEDSADAIADTSGRAYHKELDRIQSFMIEERPYKTPELTLYELADQVGLSPRLLSQILNVQLKQSFFEFVNAYRIREAASLLRNSSSGELRINEIMYEVGFNSKSSFNTFFKKHTGMTPSQYRSRHRV